MILFLGFILFIIVFSRNKRIWFNILIVDSVRAIKDKKFHFVFWNILSVALSIAWEFFIYYLFYRVIMWLVSFI